MLLTVQTSLSCRNGLLHTSAVYTVEPLLSSVIAPLTAPLHTHSLSLSLLLLFPHFCSLTFSP
ncbi:hypothetical protein QQF64_028266, partial [Cirrhinus molitorella]